MHEQSKTHEPEWLALAIILGACLAIMVQRGLSARNLMTIEMTGGVLSALIVFLYTKWLKQRITVFRESLHALASESL
jgi:hypothetical protein